MKRLMKAIFRSLLWISLRLRARRVVVFYAWPDFQRKAEALADVLRRRGVRSVVATGNGTAMRNSMVVSPDVFIGFWNDHPNVYLPSKYIFFNAEPLSVPRWRDNTDWFDAMAGALEVWGYSMANEAFVRPLGVPFRYVPFGYAPYYEQVYQANVGAEHLSEDIDVLFFGTLSERRATIIDELRARDIKVESVTRDNPRYGADLDRTIARSKIILGIFSFDDPSTHIADFARLDHLLSNKRFVLHEELAAASRDEAFENAVATAAYERLTAQCEYFLRHDAERRAHATRSHDWFKAHMSIESFLSFDAIRALLA